MHTVTCRGDAMVMMLDLR